MPAGPDPLRRWAAVHARSLCSDLSAPVASPAVSPAVTQNPGPVVVSSVTEIRAWDTDGLSGSVGLGVTRHGRVLAAAPDRDNSISIWDVETGELNHRLTGHTSYVYTAVWGTGSDGRPLLATNGDDGTRLWDPETGIVTQTWTGNRENRSPNAGYTDSIGNAAWGYRADGRPLLALACITGEVLVVEPETGGVLHSLVGGDNDDDDLLLSVSWGYGPHGEALLAGGNYDGTVRIWDLTNDEPRHILSGLPGMVTGIAWAAQPGEQPVLVAAGNAWTEVRVWRIGGDGEFTAESLDLGPEGSLDWVTSIPLPDRRSLLLGTGPDTLRLFDGRTLSPLHTERCEYGGYDGPYNGGWAITPDGRLLVSAASGRGAVVWQVELDPPLPPPVPPAKGAPASDRPASRVPAADDHWAGQILNPPVEVAFGSSTALPHADLDGRESTLACTTDKNGHIVVAVGTADSIQAWDLSAGRVIAELTQPGYIVDSIACAQVPDGYLVVAFCTDDNSLRTWDLGSGEVLTVAEGQRFWGLDLAGGARGRPRLAAGSDDGIVRIWDPLTGEFLHSLVGHATRVEYVAWGRRPDGRLLLASSDLDASVLIWDGETGLLLRTLTDFDDELDVATPHIAWGYEQDGTPLLAATVAETVRIWRGEAIESLHAIPTDDEHVDVAWGRLSDGRSLLATSDYGRIVYVWDGGSGAELTRINAGDTSGNGSGRVQDPAWVTNLAGDLFLIGLDRNFAAAMETVRMWQVATAPQGSAAAAEVPNDIAAQRYDGLVSSLLRLGLADLWPPLGLVADLVMLTGPDGAAPRPGALSDERVAALADDAGVARLRQLGWPSPARTAFAALLASGLTIPDEYAPPSGPPTAGEITPQALRAALRSALAEPAGGDGTPPSWPMLVSELRAAASLVTDRTATLLSVLGHDACAADPMLPVRLAHHAPALPSLRPADLRLLAAATTGYRPTARTARTGTDGYSPGTVGLARTGPLTRLLPTQLALPRDVMTIHRAESQLLYREHRAPELPAPEPLTIILDTTPPTFGPAGSTLRLAAHLLSMTLWEHGKYPSLITLAEPEAIIQLRSPADLIRLWTGSTLNDPAKALGSARVTAATTGQPAVLCTHHHTARGCWIPGPGTRLLTTHQPPEPPPAAPVTRWHAHLPPNPTQGELAAAITRLLVPAAEGGW